MLGPNGVERREILYIKTPEGTPPEIAVRAASIVAVGQRVTVQTKVGFAEVLISPKDGARRLSEGLLEKPTRHTS